jgi:hypothetical protein
VRRLVAAELLRLCGKSLRDRDFLRDEIVMGIRPHITGLTDAIAARPTSIIDGRSTMELSTKTVQDRLVWTA